MALMEIQASRAKARVSATGEPILLLEQDRGLWDRTRIDRGLTALERAESLIGVPGPYLLQAEIAACHARAQTAEETDWSRIVGLYTELARVTRSPVIELNRAVAVSMAIGPEQALGLLEPLLSEPALKSYHLLPSVRGDLLARLSRHSEAAAEFERAATLTRNERERSISDGTGSCQRRSRRSQGSVTERQQAGTGSNAVVHRFGSGVASLSQRIYSTPRAGGSDTGAPPSQMNRKVRVAEFRLLSHRRGSWTEPAFSGLLRR